MASHKMKDTGKTYRSIATPICVNPISKAIPVMMMVDIKSGFAGLL